MPLSIQYIAKRGLSAGHVVDTEYEITQSLFYTTPDAKIKRVGKTSISRGGYVEYDHHRVERTKLYLTVPMDIDASAEMLEFLRSTEEGEPFILDELGTKAAPVVPVYCILEGNYNYKRIPQAATLMHQATFTVRYI